MGHVLDIRADWTEGTRLTGTYLWHFISNWQDFFRILLAVR